MTIMLTAVATLVVTILAGVALDFLRNRRPKIGYAVKDAIPIDLGDKQVGAYVVELYNVSKSVVKDVTCHIQAYPASLRNGGVSTNQGLEYAVTDSENSLQIAIPYLRAGDELKATVVAEARHYLPSKPEVAIRSPQELTVALGEYGLQSKKTQRGYYLFAAAVASFVSAVFMIVEATVFTPTPKDTLTFAASVAGLPHFADLYATSSDANYFNQGDLAFARAAASADRSEIERYRKFLSTILRADTRMMSSSRANLYYCLGKIDLLLGDNEQALHDFREAQIHSKATVEAKIKVDTHVREFLATKEAR